MSRIDQLREQIDACRAGGDDLQLPGLADLAQEVGEGNDPAEESIAREFDRVQAFDRAVVSALHDVDVPSAMLERLLAKTAAAADRHRVEILAPAIDAAANSPAGAQTGDATTVAAAPATSATAIPARLSRRWALAFAVA